MKTKLTIAAVLVLLLAGMMPTQAQNQRFGYVDTEYILENIPEYNDAQDELNVLSAKWEKEIKAKYDQVEKNVS